MNIKPFVTLRNMLIGGGVTAGIGLVGFSVVYSNDIENKLVDYAQIQLADEEMESSVEKLVILNGVGEINIVQSDRDNIEVESYIVYNQKVKEEKSKVNEVNFVVENATVEGDDELETYVLSSTIADGTNYFTYIENENYLNDVKINYEIEIPSTLKEIYVYNPIGNVKIYGADASLKIITYRGNIFAKNITPDDFVSAQNYEGEINISVKDATKTTYIGASSNLGDINLEIEDGSEYELGKDNPAVLAMVNNIFDEKTYAKIKNQFLEQEKFENKKLKTSTLSRKGQVTFK